MRAHSQSMIHWSCPAFCCIAPVIALGSGVAALRGSFLLVVPPLCVREVEFAFLKSCQFFMYARTIWHDNSARRAEQGLGTAAGAGRLPISSCTVVTRLLGTWSTDPVIMNTPMHSRFCYMYLHLFALIM